MLRERSANLFGWLPFVGTSPKIVSCWHDDRKAERTGEESKHNTAWNSARAGLVRYRTKVAGLTKRQTYRATLAVGGS
jgi:hypothetical protein